MKKIILLICITALILSSCVAETEMETTETSATVGTIFAPESQMETETEATTVPIETTAETEIETSVATSELIKSEPYTVTAAEKAEIQTLIYEYQEFYQTYYIDWATSATKIDETDFIKSESSSEVWNRLTDTEITTYEDFVAKLTNIFTDDKALEVEEYFFSKTELYKVKDGNLYVSTNMGGSSCLLGSDKIYIEKVGKLDEETYVLYFTSFGDKEIWGTANDLISQFYMTVKRVDGGFKFHETSNFPEKIAHFYTPEFDLI